MKAVLQSILVYRASISYIPKGILANIRKKYLSFLWTTSTKAEGIPLVKWKKIVLPKSRAGWGIKNPDLFCKAMAAKSLWRMVENPDTLWGRTMREKYCPNTSIEEWFKKPTKFHTGGSMCWKAFVVAFPLVGNWVAWQAGDGRRIRIGRTHG